MTRDDQQWHEWRRGGLGGSDLPKLLGLSNYGSPYSLWCEKVGLLEPSDESQRQRIGKRLERVIADEFAEVTGLYVVGEQTWCENPVSPWMRCTVDGFVAEFPGERDKVADADLLLGTFEAKTDARFGWPDGVPDNIASQVLWQMIVTGTRHGWVACLHAGFTFKVYEVPYDEHDATFVISRAHAFWHDHVLTGEPPATDGSEATHAALAVVHPEHTPGAGVEVDPELVARWKGTRDARLAYEKAEDVFSAELKAAIGDAEEGWVDGQRLVSWKSQQKTSLDTKALRADHPDLADKYTRKSRVRVLRPHEPKGPA